MRLTEEALPIEAGHDEAQAAQLLPHLSLIKHSPAHSLHTPYTPKIRVVEYPSTTSTTTPEPSLESRQAR